MTWRDQLRPASFRGVAFQIRAHSAEVAGRRAEIHQYPQRDVPFAEDLGLRAGEYSVDGYVLGDDYMAARDALIAACAAAGPGALVHPYLGALTVLCTGCSVTESSREGRMARFALAFAQAGENRFPRPSPDTRAATADAAADASTAVQTAFAGTFDVAKSPGYLLDAAVALVDRAIEDVEALAAPLIGEADRAAGFAVTLTRLAEDAAGLALIPASLSARVAGVARDLADLGPAGGAVAALGGLSAFGDTLASVPAGTVSRSRQAANRIAFVDLVRRSAAVESGRRSADLDFTSRQDALAARDTLAGRLDDAVVAAGDGADDEAFAALTDLRVAVIRDLSARGAALPSTVEVIPETTLPVLVLSNRLYGADPGTVISRAADLSGRNRIRHPGFVPGGEPLEALNG